ncbi:hypothetical protein [Rubripirellula tenax]|nr:hypothetical protein [Rubripirellula tenax]
MTAHSNRPVDARSLGVNASGSRISRTGIFPTAIFIAATGLACCAASARVFADHPSPHSVDVWIEQLASPAYHTRQAAAGRLLRALVVDERIENVIDSGAVSMALKMGLQHPTAEIRFACGDILRLAEQTHLDRQIERLRNPRTPVADIDLAGWAEFSELFGHDHISRSLFADLTEAFAPRLSDRPRWAASIGTWNDFKWDPYHVSAEDRLRWTMLIWLDIEDARQGKSQLTSRITMSLSNPSMGPSVGEPNDAELKRLINRWVEVHSKSTSPRNPLLIAMRYQCVDQASSISHAVMESPRASATSAVTALLVASAIGSNDVDQHLTERLGDHRTAHVWQMAGVGNIKIRTQVRDVALALLLHRRGLDPRDFGFAELQADPLLVFRDHSLGFSDDGLREQAHALSLNYLSTED